MAKKQFKAETKKLMDLMINSIYTNRDIFLRELISNSSDALDKLYYSGSEALAREDYKIQLSIDKENRTLSIEDNGCGMTAEELEKNLGTIARSGSLDFKSNLENPEEDAQIIGQFGVGFYSAFMVSKKVSVLSRVYGSDEANLWESSGVDGFTVKPAEKEKPGTLITLYIKDNEGEEDYDKYLEQYTIREIVKKYSDYIRYPIMLDMETSKPKEKENEDDETEYETVIEPTQLNSMVPLWRKNKSEITNEEYNEFYKGTYYDYTDPIHTIHSKTEGQITYDALLFIPSHAPYDYYTKEFERGLQLYCNGVLIMDKCSDLLPEFFGFVKGLVDCPDLTLNISRETLQHDHILKIIARNLEKKIKSELKKMLSSNREEYEKFWSAFSSTLKFGVYNNYGMNKDILQDLLMFTSSEEKKLVTLEEYKGRMSESQTAIYYASGETVDKIEMLPQVASVKAKGYEVLYLTEDVDEFAIQMLREYDGKPFMNALSAELDLDSEEEKEELKKANEDGKALLDKMKEILGDKVASVRFTNKLSDYAVCLTNEGMLSLEMEKVLASMPNGGGAKAELILEINKNHEIVSKLKELVESDEEKLSDYTLLLYAQACLIAGKPVDNPAKLSELICSLM